MSDDGQLPESHMGVKLLAHLYDVPDGAITCIDSYQQYIYCGFSTGQVQKFFVSFDRVGADEGSNKNTASDDIPADDDDDDLGLSKTMGSLENISTTLIASMSCSTSRTAKVKALYVTPTSDNLLFVLYKRVLSVYDATSFFKLREVATEVFTFCVSLRAPRSINSAMNNNSFDSSPNRSIAGAHMTVIESENNMKNNSLSGNKNGGTQSMSVPSQQQNVYRICCSLKDEKRVLIHEFTPATNLLTRMEDNYLFPEQVLTLAEYGGIMCVGMSREYSIVGVDGDVRSLLSLNPGEHLPTISLHESNVFLLLNHDIFCINIKSMPTSNTKARTLSFDYPAQIFTARHGAVFSFSQECCEVFGLYDDDIFQRLPVQDVRYVSDKSFFSKQVGHVVLCASQKRIWLMEMFSLREQLKDLMDRYKVDDAFDLLDKHGFQEDNTLEAEVKIIGGFAHLKNCAPFDAIALFNSLLDPREVLRYVPCLIPMRCYHDEKNVATTTSSNPPVRMGPSVTDTRVSDAELHERRERRKQRREHHSLSHLVLQGGCNSDSLRLNSKKHQRKIHNARQSQIFFEFKLKERRKRSIAYSLNGTGLQFTTTREELTPLLGRVLTDTLLEISSYDALEDPLDSVEGLFWRPYHMPHEQHDPDLSHGLERSWENVFLQLPEHTDGVSKKSTGNMDGPPPLLYYSTYQGANSQSNAASGSPRLEMHVHPKYGPLSLPHFIEASTTELAFELITWLNGVRLDPCLKPVAKRGVDYALVVLFVQYGNMLGLLRLICSGRPPHLLCEEQQKRDDCNDESEGSSKPDMLSHHIMQMASALYPRPGECFQGTLQDCIPLLAGMCQWRALYVLLCVRGLRDIAQNIWKSRISLTILMNAAATTSAHQRHSDGSMSSYLTTSLPESVRDALRRPSLSSAQEVGESTPLELPTKTFDAIAHPIFFVVEAAVPSHIAEVVNQYGTSCLHLQDPDGNTPLHIACAMLRDPLFSRNKSNASAASADEWLYTSQAHPLHPSPKDYTVSNEEDRASRRLLTVIRLLVRLGAAPEATNHAGMTPSEVAALLCPSPALYSIAVGTLCSAAIERNWLR